MVCRFLTLALEVFQSILGIVYRSSRGILFVEYHVRPLVYKFFHYWFLDAHLQEQVQQRSLFEMRRVLDSFYNLQSLLISFDLIRSVRSEDRTCFMSP